MKQHKRYPTERSTSHTLTRAVTHIRLEAVNAGKLIALDDLAKVYLALCQQYVTLFCTEEPPNKFRATCFATPLSERWHRVAIQQAAGIARSWRTNRAQAYQDYVDELLDYHEQQAEGTLDTEAIEPAWREWHIPTLSQTCIQANANVAVLEPAQDALLLTTGSRSARWPSASNYWSPSSWQPTIARRLRERPSTPA